MRSWQFERYTRVVPAPCGHCWAEEATSRESHPDPPAGSGDSVPGRWPGRADSSSLQPLPRVPFIPSRLPGLCSATPPSALPCRTQHTRPQISVGWGPAPGGALESPWGKRRRQRPRSPRPLPPSPSYGPAGPRRPLRRRPGTTLRPQPPCRALCSPAPASGPAERSGGARTLPRAATAAAPPAPRAAAAVTSVRPVTPLPGSARETAPPRPSRRAPRLVPAAPTFPSSPRGRTPPAGAARRRGARRELYAARGRQRRGGAAGGVRGVLRALRAAAARALPADARSARGAGTGASRPSSPHSAASAARPGAAMSGLLGKLFGTGAGGKGAGKGPSPQDAIQKLRETEDLLSKKQDFLEKKIEEELAAARKHGTKNKRGEWPGRAPGNRSGGAGRPVGRWPCPVHSSDIDLPLRSIVYCIYCLLSRSWELWRPLRRARGRSRFAPARPPRPGAPGARGLERGCRVTPRDIDVTAARRSCSVCGSSRGAVGNTLRSRSGGGAGCGREELEEPRTGVH